MKSRQLILGLCALLLLAVPASAQSRHHLAYSKKLGANIYIQSDSTDWCQRLVKIQIELSKNSPLISKGINSFFKNKVGPIIDEDCPAIELAVISVTVRETGREIASAKASKTDNWAAQKEMEEPSKAMAIWLTIGGIVVCLLLYARFRKKGKPEYTPERPREKNLDHQKPQRTVPQRSTTTYKKPLPPQKKARPSVVVSPDYNRRIASIPDYQAPDNGGAEGAGLRGEAKVLEVIRTVGGGMTYWGLGLNYYDRKCEFDALVVTQHGLLHVEVKNLWGKWSPTRDPGTNYVQWKRANDGKIIQSPIRQADRARRFISDAARKISSDNLPVQSVVVVTNENFEFTGTQDERVTLMRLDEFERYYDDFAYGYGASVSATSKPKLARLISFIAKNKQFPVFYDLKSLKNDKQADTHHNSTNDKDYIAALRYLVLDVWKCDKDYKNSRIWFGNTADMAPDNSQ